MQPEFYIVGALLLAALFVVFALRNLKAKPRSREFEPQRVLVFWGGGRSAAPQFQIQMQQAQLEQMQLAQRMNPSYHFSQPPPAYSPTPQCTCAPPYP